MNTRVGSLELPPVSFLVPETGSRFVDWTPHIPFLAFVLYHLVPRRFVEIGVLDGNSYFSACEFIKLMGLDTTCYGIDPWEGVFNQNDVEGMGYSGEYYDRVLRRNAEKYGTFSTLVKLKAEDAAPKFADGSIDLLHIDGDHSEEAVRRDFETWFPKVSENGVILMHDVLTNPGARMHWNEIRSIHKTFTNNFAHGLGAVFKGENHTSQLRQLYEGTKDDIEYVDQVFDMLGTLVRLAQGMMMGGGRLPKPW